LNRFARGFTLIEVLVALVLLVIGIFALSKMQVLGVRGTGFNKETTVATTLAQKKLEELKGTAYTAVASDATGSQDQMGGIAYTTTWSVNEAGASPGRYKTVTVTVTWGGRNIVITTIISEV